MVLTVWERLGLCFLSVLIASSFYESRGKLDGVGSRLAGEAALKIMENPKNPGFKMHRVDKGKDANFWSARVNDDLRLILYQHVGDFIVCYVDRHDAAYRWAESRYFEPHEVTGAAQFVVIPELIREPESEVGNPVQAPRPFANLREDELLLHGVPRAHLALVKEATEESFYDSLMVALPEEAAEALVHFIVEGVLPRPQTPAPDAKKNPFTHRDAKRRFKLVEDEAELESALDGDWEAWKVFLHPTQQDVVDRHYSGPARVTGAAGTGKTVVALHRAARTVKQDPTAQVLLTTFSKTLASRLRHSLVVLLGEGAPELDRIRVDNLHGFAAETWTKVNGKKFKLSVVPDREPLMREALTRLGADEAGIGSVIAEWNAIVNDEGVTSWDRYRVVSRAGRGASFNLAQRQQMWRVLEVLTTELAATGAVTAEQSCYWASEHFESVGSPFTHVIADEVQDFGPAELRLLAALAGESNQLFLTGDIGQRIYKGKTSFRGSGIELRGRSTRLTLNYRTTQQIRTLADSFMPKRLEDLDEEDSESRSSISLLQGQKPEIIAAANPTREIECATQWLQTQLSRGYKTIDIAIFARTKKLLEDRAIPIVRKLGLTEHYLTEGEPRLDKRISMTTMHNAKGLEFKVVLLVGVEAKYVPNQYVLGLKDDAAERQSFIDQERNLLYVACTRAREQLLITSGGPLSPFLGDVSNQQALISGRQR